MIEEKKYPGKILLFGEYLLINGGNALAIPRVGQYGNWTFKSPALPRDLLQFNAYLIHLQDTLNVGVNIDAKRWEADINQGLWFESNIPEGYGVGSSGALVAAVYDKYVYEEKRVTEKWELKRIFALMESYFHGSSSGFDPLVSYLNQPLILQGNGTIDSVQYNWSEGSSLHFFLIDTGLKRSTSPLVKQYLKSCESSSFIEKVKKEIMPISNQCIEALIHQETNLLFQQMKLLSVHQFRDFKPMIPEPFIPLWKSSLRHSDFVLKLCGAGGGGYILGLGKKEIIEELKAKFKIEYL